MAVTEKTISGYVSSQLPDFVKADHPKFKRFLELYYQWLETNSPVGISNTAGNTIYHAMSIGDYRDIDETPDEFVTYFKQELLPYFPEKSELDLKKILKSAREFYLKKGSLESLKWLFRALFNEDIEVSFPKEQILRASSGKWKQPRAFRITVTEENKNIDVSLLKKRIVTGVDSGATCVIESANRTIDVNNGKEIIEIYVSNIKRFFNNGEFITIEYVDSNGVEKTFQEKIIGTISNIRIDSNIQTDPQQKRRGLLYNVGDPVVFYGGLSSTLDAQDATAIVGNVTIGSIEAVTVTFPGYGYRLYSNTEVIVLRSIQDNPDANSSTDLRVLAINSSACTANSQNNFLEPITYDKSVIDFLDSTTIGSANFAAFTVNNKNIILNVTENDANDYYANNEQVWANGNNYTDALFTAKIATPNNIIFGLGGSANTGDILLYDVSNTGALATILAGAQINTKNTAKSFVYNSITLASVDANANSQLFQALDFVTENTSGIALISVLSGGAGFKAEPQLKVDSYYDTQLSELYDYIEDNVEKVAYRQNFRDLGQIAHVYINSGGTGYANGDTITFTGGGYGGNGNVVVNATGSIVSVNLFDRGEGYALRPTAVITTSGGSGASLTAYLYGDGVTQTIDTSSIGRIRDLRLTFRGYDYVGTPNISLKVVDLVINPVDVSNTFIETEYIYQGASITNSTFKANVDFYNKTTGLLRLYNFSGTINPSLDLITQNAVYCNVNTSVNVAAPSQYPAGVIASGLPNPMYYGNGRAKANAVFANGLIEFNGFYLNTDGFPSSDKRLEGSELYHNFSYIISSEKNLVDFKNPVLNIVHPAGMSLNSRTIVKQDKEAKAKTNVSVAVIRDPTTTTNVQVSNSYSNVITGNNTTFATAPNQANVGDLFYLMDTSNPLRSQIKSVSAITNDTQLEIKGDFIYVGQGRAKTNATNTRLIISGNVNAISDFIQVNDQVRMNIRDYQVNGTVNISGTVVVGNTTAPNVTYFQGNVVVGSEIQVNSEVRTVVTVTNNDHLVVNTAFTNPATNKYLIANSVLVKNITGISGNTLTMNTAVFATRTNLVYQVVPNYAAEDYQYKIITITS